MQRINRYWRIVATGFCFAIFGLGAIALSFIFIPIISLTSRSQLKRERQVQAMIQRAFYAFCLLMKYSGAMSFSIKGADILKQDRNCLVVANHPSLIDYVLIASQLAQCDCLVKSSLWQNPFVRHIVRAAGYIPNNSSSDLISTCKTRFERGNVLLIFPEGTRTTPNVQSTLQRGAAQIAVKTERDLRVVHIRVSPSFLTKEDKWYRVPKTKPFFYLEVKEKINIKPIMAKATSPTIAVRHLQNHLAEVLFPKS